MPGFYFLEHCTIKMDFIIHNLLPNSTALKVDNQKYEYITDKKTSTLLCKILLSKYIFTQNLIDFCYWV